MTTDLSPFYAWRARFLGKDDTHLVEYAKLASLLLSLIGDNDAWTLRLRYSQWMDLHEWSSRHDSLLWGEGQ